MNLDYFIGLRVKTTSIDPCICGVVVGYFQNPERSPVFVVEDFNTGEPAFVTVLKVAFEPMDDQKKRMEKLG